MWSPVIIMYVWCVINVCRHDQHPGACCLSAVKQGEQILIPPLPYSNLNPWLKKDEFL